jgi:hypothetical protein
VREIYYLTLYMNFGGSFLDTRKRGLLHYAVFFCGKFMSIYAKELF